MSQPGEGGEADPRLRQVLDADDARYAAMRTADALSLDALLHHSLIYTHSSGTVHDKPGFLESVRSRTVTYLATDRREVQVRWYGGSLLLHGRALIDLDVHGAHRALDILFQSVWVYEEGRWQMAAWASTPLPAKS